MRTTFTSDDGARLAGEWRFADVPRAVAVLHGATGVPAGYYGPFADWMAAQRRVHVLIYDYRDTGWSADGPVRRSRARMSDWGVGDQSAALDHALATFPDLPVWTIGHSLGGMCLAFHENADRIERHIAIASGPAHWTRHPWHFMPQVLAFWFLIGPLATRLRGYLPGAALGLKANLPAGVFWQWRRWCTSRGFHRVDWGGVMPEPQPGRVRCPVELVAFEDDVMIPPDRVRALAAFYPLAEISFRSIAPRAVGLKGIGHVAGFARRSAAAWPRMVPEFA